MKKQVFVVHGGETFDTYEEYVECLKGYKIGLEDIRNKKNRWKKNLGEDLGNDFEVILPQMPNEMNAKYAEWKIWFEKFSPLLNETVVLAGHSLGGIFLAKYLSENVFPKKIIATFLIAAPYGEKGCKPTLGDFILPQSLDLLQKQGGEIFLYQSKDDPFVPFADFEKYKNALPGAKAAVFEDRGHFLQSNFLELADDIKALNWLN
ncbi:MAG: alpha/beta hydrolase [Candidatus Paceibacterota bacterium]|jgi:hypothetical protein